MAGIVLDALNRPIEGNEQQDLVLNDLTDRVGHLPRLSQQGKALAYWQFSTQRTGSSIGRGDGATGYGEGVVVTPFGLLWRETLDIARSLIAFHRMASRIPDSVVGILPNNQKSNHAMFRS